MVMLKAWLAKQAKSSMTTEQIDVLEKHGIIQVLIERGFRTVLEEHGIIQVLIDQAISNGEIKTDDADEIDAWVQNNIIDR